MDNVTNFTGKKQSPTVIDQEQLVDFIQSYLIPAKIDSINGTSSIAGIGVITTTVEGAVGVDWFMLPGGNIHNLVSGTQILAAEIIQHLDQKVVE
ncbi:MAG: hypothetical protein L0287_05935 [Anaerolineae bacterium]|nr:hypothetical protein [Anaerolineae bacterium]